MPGKKQEKYVLDFQDNKGKRVVWEKDSFKEHSLKHPALRNKAVLEKVKKALLDPDVIISSHKKKNSLCYYLKERSLGGGKYRYTKVIVKKLKKADYIESSFRPDIIREYKYHKAIWEK